MEVRQFVDEDYPEINWMTLEYIMEGLRDIEELTTRMQKEIYLKGDFFRDMFICKEKLEEKGYFTLLEAPNDRTNDLLTTPAFGAAIICDPRLNIDDPFVLEPSLREMSTVSLIFTNTYFITRTI